MTFGFRLLALALASFVPFASGCVAFAAGEGTASPLATTAPDARPAAPPVAAAAPAVAEATPAAGGSSATEALERSAPPAEAPPPREAEDAQTPPVAAHAREPAAAPRAPDWAPLEMLGETIPPGEAKRLRFESLDSFTAGLWAARGVAPGPTLCVTAGVHGDELNGIAIARALVDETDPREIAGTLIVVPIVNAYGFRNGSRYLPDRRDLNRYFPGRRNGSAAARIAYQFFEQVVRRCDALVDLHTGSLNRANLPQIRTDLSEVDNLRLAWGFSTEHVIHSRPQPGTLRRAANDAGVAAVLYEAGEPGRIDQEEIDRGVSAIRAVMASLGMAQALEAAQSVTQRLYGRTQWVRSDASGIYVPLVELGDTVEAGQRVAEVTDPFSSESIEIVAPISGRVIGMALGQVVIPGFALLHIGVEEPPSSAEVAASIAADPDADDADASALESELADERPE